MATVAATLTNVRIDDQSIAFTLDVSGDPGGTASAYLFIYDAAGTERERTELGSMSVGQTWEAHLDLPVSKLEDGDYGAWVDVLTKAADGQDGTFAREGVAFLVGRGRVYPSHEHVDQRSFDDPPTLSPLRLEGSWLVFDMTSTAKHDVEVLHRMAIAIAESGNAQEFHGQELLRAGATQQAHYLLPEHLEDGRYVVAVSAQNEGSDYPSVGVLELQVSGGVVTVI
jgi:hypothetical protein